MSRPQRSSRKPQTKPCCMSRELYLQAERKRSPAALGTLWGSLPTTAQESFLLPHIHIKLFHHRQQAQAAGSSMSIGETSSCSRDRNAGISSSISPKCRFSPLEGPAQVLLVFWPPGHPAAHLQLLWTSTSSSFSIRQLPPAWLCPFQNTCTPARLPQQLPNFQRYKK